MYRNLARAERLHEQFLQLRPLVGTREPSGEPPIDVLETDREKRDLVMFNYRRKSGKQLLILRSSQFDAVDGSSTGTSVPWMWALLRLPTIQRSELC